MTTLYINPSESRCGACGRGCNPYEKSHEQPAGYQPEPGCGAVYTQVGTSYTDFMGSFARIKEMRPDLEWVGVEMLDHPMGGVA